VTAVEISNQPGRFAVFLADPGGGVYTASGNASDGWSIWTSVSEGRTTPGAPIAAVSIPGQPGRFALFLADPNGGIYTTSGNARDGWDPWSSVADGRTTPGAPVTAMAVRSDSFDLFMSDTNGRISRTSGSAQSGWNPWTSVTEETITPGAPVTAVHVPFFFSQFALFVADTNGEVRATSGSGSRFDALSSVSEGRTTPGARVTTVPVADIAGGMAVFVADPAGRVYTTATRLLPQAAPSGLRVTNVADRKISVAWSDRSNNETGFNIRFNGKREGFSDHSGTQSVGSNVESATLTGLQSNREYTISVAAVNQTGESRGSNQVQATTPARRISVTSQGTGASTVFTVNGSGFTADSRVVIKITGAQLQQLQFAETAGADGKFASRHAVACTSGIQLTFTAFEDADPDGTFANAIVTNCP
jgi:hypothetical protein